MAADLLGVPWQIWAAAWTALVGLAAWFGRSIWSSWAAQAGRETDVMRLGWSQVKTRDQQIDLLRRLLDRSRRRENAYATAFELVLLSMTLPEAEQSAVIARARQILETGLGAASPDLGGGK